jgi:signal transduction histidine kinase
LQVLQGKQRGRPAAPFDLDQVLAQALDQNLYAAAAKQIRIHRAANADLPPAFGDAAHTHQIVSNYLSNAIKYSPPGSEVAVSIRLAGARLRVEVGDQGPGIAPQDRPRLFVEFAKISNKPTGGETSTGLGLSIVKHLAEAQGGGVGADFPPEGGSVFWFEVPAALPGGAAAR